MFWQIWLDDDVIGRISDYFFIIFVLFLCILTFFFGIFTDLLLFNCLEIYGDSKTRHKSEKKQKNTHNFCKNEPKLPKYLKKKAKIT